MLKNKRILLVVGAMVFVVALFLLKTQSVYKSQSAQAGGLTYNSNITVKDLLATDTDGDGVPDWEENLYGTDPSKPQTTPGTPDSVAIQKIQEQNKASAENNTDDTASPDGTQALTQTDKFSQQLFATVAALSETGAVDDGTVDKLTTSLSSQLQNAPARKVYTITDINVITDTSASAVKKYDKATDVIFANYPKHSDILKILQDAEDSNGNLDATALSKLDIPIQELQKIINGMTIVQVPQNLASLHLDLINALEKIQENLSDIELVNTDSVVALSAMSQYENNNTNLETTFTNMLNAIKPIISN